MPRFYTTQALSLDTVVELEEGPSHHIARVLRMTAGGALTLFNGQGGEYDGELIEVGKRSVSVRLASFRADDRESPLHTHLGQVLSKGERMGFVIQKATELGVSVITPLYSERCEVRLKEERSDKKLAHWHGIAIAACEQCGRNRLPEICEPQRLEDWLGSVSAERKLVLHVADGEADPLAAATLASCALLIGPEGGLSEREVTLATQQGFQRWQLGPRILRTETAPLAALALLQARFGDWA